MERERQYMPDGTPPGTGAETGGPTGTPLTPEQRAKIEDIHGPEVAEAISSALGGPDRATGRSHRRGLGQVDEEKLPKDWHIEEYMSPQGFQIEVPWPDTLEEAGKYIRKLLGTIEIRKSDITQLTATEHQNASAILEILESRDEPGKSKEENEKQRAWASRMRTEIKARIALHNAFVKYENGNSVKEVAEAMGGIDSGWMDAIFQIEEKSSKTGADFNPFVEALQFYEDHGHEFARHNSRQLRSVFGEKVQKDLENRYGGNAKDYEWAQNMAERLFRSTGRAIMYDYLVINKGKPNETVVGINHNGNERVEWASGRDGCDYPMSKIYRFRENLRSSSEAGLMRSNIELLDGVDLYAGDFWSRTVRDDFITTLGEKPQRITYRVADENDRANKIAIKAKKLREDDPSLTEGKAIDEASKFYFVTDEQNPLFRQADTYADRETADNKGEVVGKINFRMMGRKLDKEGKAIEGMNFTKMGDNPWGLWISRHLVGPESAKDPLSGAREAFLLNSNFETAAKLINTFDYSKENTWKVKEQLIKNLIKYGREKIEETGKQRWSEEYILAGVNKLTGLTDPNAPQFIQLPERMGILKEYFNIELSKKDEERIKQQLEKIKHEAEVRLKGKYPDKTDDEIKKEVDNIVEEGKFSAVNRKLNEKIEERINRSFVKSFGLWFLWGALKGSLKQALAELGVK